MNCQTAREVLPELLDRRTPDTSHPEVRTHLANCPDCQREFAALTQTVTALDAFSPAPSARLRQNFYAMLEEEKHSAASVQAALTRKQRPALFRLAWIRGPALACGLVLAGFKFGAHYGTVPSAAAPEDVNTKRELIALREQVNKMSQLVGYSLLQQQQGPVNERLRDVLLAADTKAPDAKVLDELISALAFDPSANVRLRALEALYAHSDDNVVRSGVLAAMPREQHPLVQLEMIEFMASAHEREAAPLLEKMSRDEAIEKSVRVAAQRALAQL